MQTLRVMVFFTFKIKKSLMISLVIVRARYTIKGTAANQVNMKLYGSESSKMYVISKPVMSSRKKNLKVYSPKKRNMLAKTEPGGL